ncbi:hypothetical protein DID76_01385 [Candidatus Marinamargulisbacteria bacterium SCGC AG-414-C22]|nr:hypothetical protein DID76_01385 [Candidatus Marinamargulisbacteria bacterium SCGC AG-414-C22]
MLISNELVKDIKEAAYLEGDFVTRAGKKTNYYIDKYLFETKPNILTQLAAALATILADKPFDLIAAPAFGAVPIATALAFAINKPFIIIQHQDNDDPLILGDYQKGQNVIIIEDILTSGKTALETAQYLTQIQLTVTEVVAIVDREEGGLEKLSDAQFGLTSLIKTSDFQR